MHAQKLPPALTKRMAVQRFPRQECCLKPAPLRALLSASLPVVGMLTRWVERQVVALVRALSAHAAARVRHLPAKDRHVSEVLLALCDAASVAGLVLPADEAVRRAAPERLAIDIGAGSTDLVLDV